MERSTAWRISGTVLKRMPRSGSFILGIKSKSQGLKFQPSYNIFLCGENCAYRVQSNMFKLFCVKVAWLYSSGHLQQICQNMLIIYLLFTARLRSEFSQCGICGGQSGTWTGFTLCSLLRSCLISVIYWWNVPFSFYDRMTVTDSLWMKPTDALNSSFIGLRLHMFRAAFLSIIRSS